jgi:hypothetical protein
MNGFTFYMILAPVIAVATTLFIYWLTGWMDRLDRRRQHRAAE